MSDAPQSMCTLFFGGRVDWLDTRGRQVLVLVGPFVLVTLAAVVGRLYASDSCQPLSENTAAQRCSEIRNLLTWLGAPAAAVLLMWVLTLRFARRDVTIAGAVVLTLMVAAAGLFGPALWVAGSPASGP